MSITKNTPVILLAGAAGVGKDTVGQFLADKYNAVTIGQADPLKRFAKQVFGFSDEQLWGPSEFRNALAPHISQDLSRVSETIEDLRLRYGSSAGLWLTDVMPGATDDGWRRAMGQLDSWFRSLIDEIAAGKGLSPRKALQTLGTEWGREQDQDLWVNYAKRVCQKLLRGGFGYGRAQGLYKLPFPSEPSPDYVVITDGRFRNEILSVRENGGSALLIIDPRNTSAAAVEAAGVKNHKSEKELGTIPQHFYTGVVINDGTLEELYGTVANTMIWIYGDDRGARMRYA